MSPVVTFQNEAREYCFVIMPYSPEFEAVFSRLQELVESHTGLRCIRADRDPQPGKGLLENVHQLILNASIVLVDLSMNRPNVYYELGLAVSHERHPVLLIQKGQTPHTDLTGLERLEYESPTDFGENFETALLACLDRMLHSPIPEQRRMLCGSKSFPTYIIAAPRVPQADSRHIWHPPETRTFGDNLGITGILTAYGNLFGTKQLPSLLHAQYVPETFRESEGNVFCIGSPKVNPWTGHFLDAIQVGRSPRWEMREAGEGTDRRVMLQGYGGLDELLKTPVDRDSNGQVQDFGLIVRAPHPRHPSRIVMVAAGRHSIGTHAACSAIVNQELIKRIEDRLAKWNISLNDKETPFWAFVRGTLVERADDVADPVQVEIVEVGGYERRQSSDRSAR